MPSPANLPGVGAEESDSVLPESVLPAVARAADVADAFEDELPAGSAATPPASAPFDDEVPEFSAETRADPLPEPEGVPFDPIATTPSEADAAGTTNSDSGPATDDELMPFESTAPASTTPVVAPETTEEPAWAPRTLPMDDWKSPPRPMLSVKARSPSAVHRGEIVTAYYDIKNTGNAPAEDVVLTVRLPEELLHKHGAVVEHRIERLGPGESRRARLQARARSTGTARLDAKLSHGDQDDELAAVSIRVVGQSAAPRR
jgi:hypothetical protein